jgi:hypothetical protein
LLADLRHTATQLGQLELSQQDYQQFGRFSPITVCRRFGSWKLALQRVGLEPAHWINVPAGDLLADITRVAAELKTRRLRFHDYIQRGKYSRKVINRLFGRWQTAIETAGLLPVIQRPQSRKELFDNLKNVWQQLGHKPRYDDLSTPISRFGPSAYTIRFGTFQKAMAAFTRSLNPLIETDPEPESKMSEEDRTRGFVRRTPRTVNLRLRFMVLRRDHFRCQACGRSPATDPTVKLQVDHKEPWSTGGETILENLQTLCEQCNAGKSDLPWTSPSGVDPVH